MSYKSLLTQCSDEEFINIIKSSFTYKEALEKLGYSHSGGAYITLRKRIKSLNISTEHMTPTRRYGRSKNKITNEEMFTINSRYGSSIRRRVLQDKLVPYKCAICGNTGTWRGKPLTLTLDHINGNHCDNRIENLQFVCPNCDSQQSTFGARNKMKYTIDQQYAPVQKREPKLPQVTLKVTKEQFLKELKTFTSFTELGKRFSVSDNAVRKWCIKWELPSSTSSMREYIKNL